MTSEHEKQETPLALKQIEDLVRGLGDRGKDLLQKFFREES